MCPCRQGRTQHICYWIKDCGQVMRTPKARAVSAVVVGPINLFFLGVELNISLKHVNMTSKDDVL